MRKLLLATVATLGMSAALDGSALAQLSVDYSGDQSGQSAPAPGTITVRLNGRFQFFAGVYRNSDFADSYYYDSATGAARNVPFVVAPNGTVVTTGVTVKGATVTPPKTAGGVAVPANYFRAATQLHEKQANYNYTDIARLYPGFDGVAANGLKYGASFEIRASDIGGAGGAVYASPSNVSRTRDTLQFRRAWGYLGTDDLGTLRFGMVDGPASLFMVGNFENFNTGGWNGTVPASFNSQFDNLWPFFDVGASYATNKIVYLSPQVYGFDFGASFEPNTAGLNGDNQDGCESATFNPIVQAGPGSVAGQGCDTLSSTAGGDLRRRRNTIDAAIRYRGTFGPVGVAAFADYQVGGKVNDSSFYLPGKERQVYKGYSVGEGGAQVTFAGFTVGGMGLGGNLNNIGNNEALQPAGVPGETAYLAGASYTVGPLVVGAHWFQTWQAGAQNSGNKAEIGGYSSQGLAAGGTYSLAPGLAVYGEYLWGSIKQNGQDLDLGVAGETHNKVEVQYIGVGTGLSW